MKKSLLLLSLFVWSPSAISEPIDSVKLLSFCKLTLSNDESLPHTGEDFVKAGLCLGIISGVNGVNQLLAENGQTPIYCPDEGIKYADLVEVVIAFLKREGSKYNFDATLSVLQAFTQQFPCKG